MTRWIYAFAAAAGVFIIVAFGWLWYSSGNLRDETFNAAMKKINALEAYRQEIETEFTISDRHIRVTGIYDIDNKNKRYGSRSTTTLTLLNSSSADGREHSFTLENVALPERIFVKIETESELLKKSVPETNGWKHFPASNIPETYRGIAVAGPVTDVLPLFGDNGAYVEVMRVRKEGRARYIHYTLRLSPQAFGYKGRAKIGIMEERIGAEGTIDVWINKDTFWLERIWIQNHPYRSVVLVSDFENVGHIEPPL